jgi:2-polyprenyl-3-methyl-5-hydroxy-6-metoxy-1,4-benzoquinol methylase
MHRSENDLYWICDCGIITTDQKLDRSIYDEKYANKYVKYEGTEIADNLNRIRREWVQPNMSVCSSVLDYGCAVGTFLSSMNGWCCKFGYDINPIAMKLGTRMHHNVTFLKNKKVLQTLAPYDALTCFDVIEHMANPLEEFGEVVQSVKRGGYIFVSTPNPEICNIELIPKTWRHFWPEHLHFFTEKGLRKFFEILSIDTIAVDYRESEARKTYPRNILCMTGIKQ